MNGKFHSEQSLTKMIDVATQYIEDPDLRNAIVSKCHQGIGMLVTGFPINSKTTVNLSDHETAALERAVRKWRRDRKRMVMSSNP